MRFMAVSPFGDRACQHELRWMEQGFEADWLQIG
jgi:hypothetical protein